MQVSRQSRICHRGRLKATYTFSSKSFLRLIGQHVKTDRDPALYNFAVNENISYAFQR